MTVSTTTRRVSYTGDGATVAFTVPFRFLVNTDLAVYLNDVLLPAGYTVAGAGGTTGTVTFVTAPAASVSVVILGNQPNTQQTVIPPSGPFPAVTVETMADKAMIAAQQLQQLLRRSLVGAPSDADWTALAAAASRLDKVLGFNATTGQPETSTFTMTQLASVIAAIYTAAAGPLDALSFLQAGTGAVSSSAQDKGREIVSILDFMTAAQRADAKAGALVLDQTAPVQAAINYLVSIGGGVLEWYSVKVTGALIIQGSNITIRPRGGNRLVQAGDVYNTFLIYPSTLNSIWNGTGRPPGFASGIDGAPELLMYESNDADRLHDIRIEGLVYSYTGTPASGVRFIDALSVDRLKVIGCTGVSKSNTVSAWYCRSALVRDCDLTAGAGTFPLFYFKTYGLAENNDLRNGFNGFDSKGCYPQAGKGTLDAFDAGYQFFHPVKAVGNRVYNASNTGMQFGYRDNSASDISDTIVTGVTKSQWYGQVWGAEFVGNTVIYNIGTPAVGTSGIATNLNSKYGKVRGNVLYNVGIFTLCSDSIDIEDNTIIGQSATSTPAISVQGGTVGAGTRNATGIRVRNNNIVGTQSGQASIRFMGADNSLIEGNFIRDGSSATSDIRVDSTASATTSTGNQVLRNTVIKTAVDFKYPIISTGAAGTVVDQNRAYGGWFSGNALDSDGFADAHYKRGVVSADTANVYVGSAGTCSVGQNFGDQNATTPETGYGNAMAYNGMVAGSNWQQSVRFGAYFLWVDSSGKLRIKSTKPTGDTDGTVVGTQT